MRVDADIEGGAIEVIDAARASNVALALRPDTRAEFMQWFHFRARGEKGRASTFRITNAGLVPSMNPDGGVLGNLRTNAAGANLNREWAALSLEESPEVLYVREKMSSTGVDLFLDIHGDERNPYCFAAGCEGNPSYSPRIDELEDLFMESLIALDDDFQREYGYERDAPGEGDLTTAGNYVGETFDCLSLTIEMPFKDNANHPDAKAGWSPERAMHLGRSTLETVFVCLDSLR